MMAPLRVEYLANPRYGVQVHGRLLTAEMIAMLAGVIAKLRAADSQSGLGLAVRQDEFFCSQNHA